MQKKILDVTCGNRSIWFDKHNPSTIYCDKRKGVYDKSCANSNRTIVVDPDVVCDFTNLPFEDNQFKLVVFDPPQLKDSGNKAWLTKMYGVLDENWPQLLHDGFCECMRVLEPDGILIFKWSEHDIAARDVWRAIGQKPLFGHHSGKKMNTYWGVFMKGAQDEK